MARSAKSYWRGQVRLRYERCSARLAAMVPGGVFGLLVLALATVSLGCETLIGADFERRFRLARPGELLDGGTVKDFVPLQSCQDNGASCGSFRDEARGLEVYCGSCPAEQVCIDNKCTCDPVSCGDLGVECGYLSNGCNSLQYCGSCEQLYPNDPTKAYCHADGKCGDATGLPKTCEELRAQGRNAECGEVGVGETLLSCGSCEGRELCLSNDCRGYLPLKCDEISGGGLLCGTFPDGNGGAITCGCSQGEVCAAGGVCCAPRTECPAHSCGAVPDGCGGTIQCGGCAAGEACLDNVCCTDNPQCPVGVCGEIRLCGQTLLCGECAGDDCCVKDEQGMGRCHTPSCPANGLCGDNMPNGCGGIANDCGCPQGLTCSDGRCECMPKECPTDGTCGQFNDGCGGSLSCGCGDGQTCVDGQCCTPTCPEGACGLQPDGCGGLIACNICGPGEVCNNGACMTPSCPGDAACGSNLTNGVVLACLGTCSNGEACSARNGTYTCGDCAAECPENGTCGLTDLGCTQASCPGTCGLPEQVCVNRAQTGKPDNYQCCSARCPVAQSIACGAYQDPACPGSQTSCPGMCPQGQFCIATDGVFACKTITCPANARCGSNEVEGVVVQCPGSCGRANEQCVREGSTYSCICSPNVNACDGACNTTADDGCSDQLINCTCSGTNTCVDGECCSPVSAADACIAAGATCGVIQEANCGVDRFCGSCAADQVCTAQRCACDPTKCAAHQTCNATTQRCECDSSKCPAGQECNAQGACTCDSDQCPSGQVCNNQGMCACAQTVLQACEEVECGSVMNECGVAVDCPACAKGFECVGNECVCSETLEETCAKFECAGMVMNSCGRMVDCSTVNPCEPGYACASNECVCTQIAAAACALAGAECGSVMNTCGELVNCPACATGRTCDAATNQCVCDETPEEACARAEVRCGTALDACGNTVECPNTCTLQQTCEGNTCRCAQSDAMACAGKDCGTVTNTCNQTVTCLNRCDPDTERCSATGNVCVCNETDAEACGAFECGQTTNQCGQQVNCGVCDAEDNRICDPTTRRCVCDDADPCAGRICGTVTDACDEERTCGAPCPEGTACTPAGTCEAI